MMTFTQRLWLCPDLGFIGPDNPWTEDGHDSTGRSQAEPLH
jgi:hypothetical protein